MRVLITVLLAAGALPAQLQSPLFPNPSYFRHHFSTPRTRVELQPPVRLEDFVVDGTLELSLRNYLELVLANNTDIAIQRLSLQTFQNNIVRQYGIFDPNLVASFNTTRQKNPSSSAIQGANVVNSLSQMANFNYTQTLQNGTQFNVGFRGDKSSDNSAFTTYNPALNAQLTMGFTQPLLRNRGGYITRLPIMVARSQLKKSEFDLRDSLLRLLSDAENAYWDVVDARENLRVQEAYLKLNAEFLKRSKRELELGAMSALDIYRPQQQYASAEVAVSRYQFLLAQRVDALRRQMGADLDPQIRRLPIVLTETPLPPTTDSGAIDQETSVEKALAMRPDLKSVLQSLDVDELNVKSATNMLRPDFALTGGYVSRGRGGTFFQRQNVFGGGSQVTKIIPGGFADALDQLFAFNIPTYQFGLTLRLPIRDRRATADLANALVAKKLDTLRARSTEQRVRLDVLNAINQLESAKAGVKLATVARDFSQKQLEAEQKKYDLGTSIPYFVMQAQSDLVAAESQLVSQTLQYRRSMVNLLRMTGELLEERGVVVQ